MKIARLVSFGGLILLIGIITFYTINQSSEASSSEIQQATSSILEDIPNFDGLLIQDSTDSAQVPYFISWQSDEDIATTANKYREKVVNNGWQATELVTESDFNSFEFSNTNFTASVFVISESEKTLVNLTVYRN